MTKKRAPFPNYEAIYFVTPNEKSIDKIIADFSGEKPLYAAAHLFFVASTLALSLDLEDALFAKIKKSTPLKVAFEQLIFTLDQPNALQSLFNSQNPSQQDADLAQIATRLVSLCVTLGEFPYIRYFNSINSTLSSKLASLLQSQLEDLKKVDDSFPPKTEYRKAILIITDRSFDMLTPLMHEFTYQSMMSDLLMVDSSCRYSAAPADQSAASTAYANLDENDAIWNTIRHRHFAEAVQFIRDNFQKFLSENKAASNAIGGDDQKGVDTLKAMKDTLSSLPQFQEMKAKYSVHINICQECKTLFEKRRLDLVGLFQQDLATGETADGQPLKNAMLDLVPVLDNKTYDKLRSLMIYIIAMEGVQDMERRRLLETAKLTSDESQAIINLSFFHVTLSSDGRSKPDDKDRYSYWGSHKLARKRARSKAASDDMPYDLSRYVPLIKRVAEDQINNALPKELFPWVVEPANEELGIKSMVQKMFTFTSTGLAAPDPKYPNSLRTTRASWVGKRTVKTGNKKDPDDKKVDDLRRNGCRVIIFTLGGMTYSEIRSAYELVKESQREVIFGSTYVYHPNQFVDILKDLHKAEKAPVTSPLVASPTLDEAEPVKEKKGLFSKKK